MTTMEDEIAGLDQLSTAGMRQRWIEVTGTASPRVSARLLRLALAWELQAKRYGGLSRETTRNLDQRARGLSKTAPARAGMRLVREWQGRSHVVLIGEDQIIRWNGREWRSLSEVARAITGTRWSGPAFFGLRTRAAA